MHSRQTATSQLQVLSQLDKQTWYKPKTNDEERVRFTPEEGPKARPDFVSVLDLRMWQKLWELSDWQVVLLLRLSRKRAVKYLYGPSAGMLSMRDSDRFLRIKTKDKDKVLKKGMSNNPRDLPGILYSWPNKVLCTIQGVRSLDYLACAYTHGLWPPELSYYRRRLQARTVCLIVHEPTKLYAESTQYVSYEQNRRAAESTLAKKVSIALGKQKNYRAFRFEIDRTIKLR